MRAGLVVFTRVSSGTPSLPDGPEGVASAAPSDSVTPTAPQSSALEADGVGVPSATAGPTADAAATTTSTPPVTLRRFNAFSGVFTPSILTILGVIMYLRAGWVTGQVGALGAIAIVMLAHLITIATGLSVSSIATNRTVGAGGAYNIISRSLGAPAGAAIGIPLFLAQALSVAFYVVGFTESIILFCKGIDIELSRTACTLISSVSLAALVVLSGRSAALAIKAQYIIMGAIVLSLVAMFTGGSDKPPETIDWFGQGTESFSVVFAVFFPAVTGIMAGVGMSGDLKNPRTDLPRGTMAAILVGMVVYVALPLWLASNVSSDELVANHYIVWDLATIPALIFIGVWGATLSSALGSILTAPRTLQALANDGLVPRLFGRGRGEANEPILGLVATFVLAQAAVLLGSLDIIAPILTMFFLATYGLTNLACGLERWAASPSFRPAYQLPAIISLLGALACFYVMSIIHLGAMIVAMVICAGIFLVVEHRNLDTTFGDARHGIWSALVRSALFRLRRASFHPGNWRPNLVVLGGDPQDRPWLLHFGSSIVQDRGIVSYFHLLEGDVRELAESRKTLLATMEGAFSERVPSVFFRVEIVDELYRGVVIVAQSYGVGSLEANAIMLGWPTNRSNYDRYGAMLRDLVDLDRSLFLVRFDPERRLGNRKRIHIWWGGLKGNGGLMLLLAYLLTASDKWRGAEVDVITVVEGESAKEAAEQSIGEVLRAAHLDAKPKVLLRGKRTIPKIMREQSVEADLAILGIGLPEPEEAAAPFFQRIELMLAELPTTIVVHSARNFAGEPVLFDAEEPPA